MRQWLRRFGGGSSGNSPLTQPSPDDTPLVTQLRDELRAREQTIQGLERDLTAARRPSGGGLGHGTEPSTSQPELR